MIMRDSEIKTLFAKADEQVHVDEIRKQKTYHAMIEKMEKQRTPMMSTKNILFHQFWYMDKLFFAVYGVLICLGIIFITALQYTGLNQNEMITVCMVGAGWNLEHYQQANARLHRQGQQHPVTVYQLICTGTVDERAAAALEGKKGVQQGLLDSLNYLMRKYNE